MGAGPYHDTSEEGKYYAVVLEQVQGHLQSPDSIVAVWRDRAIVSTMLFILYYDWWWCVDFVLIGLFLFFVQSIWWMSEGIGCTAISFLLFLPFCHWMDESVIPRLVFFTSLWYPACCFYSLVLFPTVFIGCTHLGESQIPNFFNVAEMPTRCYSLVLLSPFNINSAIPLSISHNNSSPRVLYYESCALKEAWFKTNIIKPCREWLWVDLSSHFINNINWPIIVLICRKVLPPRLCEDERWVRTHRISSPIIRSIPYH